MSLEQNSLIENLHDLQPCKIRRNYLCKECDYATTNPREFLYHQRDEHSQKGSIHECPYCVYASPHSHKLNRHVSIIHSSARAESARSKPILTPKTSSLCEVQVCSPPLLIRQVTSVFMKSPEREVILLEEDETSLTRKKTTRRLLLEPAIEDMLWPISPMPTLFRSAAYKPSKAVPVNKSGRLLKASLVSQKPAKMSLLHKEYSCSLCSFKSKSTIVIQQHEKMFHLKKKFFRCSRCNYVTNIRSRYTKHLRYHSMPYIKCNLCDFSTPYKWNLDRHLRYHLGSSSNSDDGYKLLQSNHFRCKRCSFVASSGQSLNMHVLNHHGGKPRPRRIESVGQTDCMEEFTVDDSSKENDQNVCDMESGGIDKPEFEGCDTGDDDIINEDMFNENTKILNDNSSNFDIESVTAGVSSGIYSCSECDDKFSSVPLLDRHMYECHDIDNPRVPLKRTNPNTSSRFRDNKNAVQCDVCSYKAKWVSEMVKHRRVHTKDKPYACVHCQFRTRWKGDMTRHMLRYHKSASEKSEESSATPSSDNIDCLLDQSMTIGGEEELNIWSEDGNGQEIPLDLSFPGGCDNDTTPFKDNDPTYLEQAPQNSIRLSGGKIVHKKYQCPHCNFMTPTPSRFHMHIVGHINPKPFMCSECGYRSNWQWDITKHAKMKSIRDEAHLNASVVCVNEYGSSNYERYEQYAVYEMDNGASAMKSKKENSDRVADGEAQFNDDDMKQTTSNNAERTLERRRITYKCKHCDFKNPLKKIVVRHMIVHSCSKKRFCCGICGHTSHWKYIILRHCRHVHGKAGPILSKDSSPSFPLKSETATKLEGEMKLNNEMNELQAVDPPISKGVEVISSEDKEKSHKCSICPYRCRKVFDLRIHSYLHRPREGAVFKCVFCPFFVSLKRSWLNHMRLHVDRPQDYLKQLKIDNSAVNNNSGTTKYDIAEPMEDEEDKEFARDDKGVPRVLINREGVIQKMFKCRHCPHISKKRSVIVTHEEMHSKRNIDAGQSIYKCLHCNYTSKNAGVLTSHQKVHQGGMNSFVGESSVATTCTELDDGKLKVRIKMTDAGEDMKNLAFVTSPTDTKLYHSCNECPAKFTKHSQMLTHRTFHGAPLPWQCDQCSYAARHRPHLHRHQRVHTEEYHRSFEKQENKIGDHIAMSLGDSTSSVRGPTSIGKTVERKYKCQMCPAIFLKYSTLVYHMHLHNNNGKYQCSYCTYSVSNVGNLARHTKIHEVMISVPTNDINSVDKTQGYEEGNDSASSCHPFERSRGRFACSKCPAIFDKQIRFNVHMNLHGSAHRFRCDKCDYAVKFAAILIRHRALHTVHEKERTTIGSTSMSILKSSLKCITKTSTMEPIEKSNVSMVNSHMNLIENQSRTVSTGCEVVEKLSDLKKLFCCDRCPYVHQRKDAVQSHLKRHLSITHDSSLCPHCDYGTTIHSFLREHIKLHFKQAGHHQPDGYLRWDALNVWAQESLWKTLVFKYQCQGTDVPAVDSVIKIQLNEEYVEVASIVSELISKIECFEKSAADKSSLSVVACTTESTKDVKFHEEDSQLLEIVLCLGFSA